jgi:hypothetical protein
LAFHVNVAPHAVLDHNTSTPASALTQFIQILLFVFSLQQADHSRRSPLLTCTYLCRITELTPSSEERLRNSTVHLFTVVTTQGAYRRRRSRIRAKLLKMSCGERRIDGDVQGDCRRLWQIAESNVVFSTG